MADAYDSLNHDQVFREGKDHDDILKILMKDSGTRYDGNVVCALARWMERDGVPACVAPPDADDALRPPAGFTGRPRSGIAHARFSAQLYDVER